jgi:hypothetical protein
VSLIQSDVNKYRFPGIVVPEKAFWHWRDFLCCWRGHAEPFEDGYSKGFCRRCFRRIVP